MDKLIKNNIKLEYKKELGKNMNTNPLVSIVIPIFNVEKYIERCLSSLIKQDYTNIEIIVIDDGSLDNSAMIVDNLALFDKRIILIHEENKGVSSARNIGIDKAQGSYIMFIDGDDWVDSNYVSTFLKRIEESKAPIVMNTNYYADSGKEVSSNNKINNISTITNDTAAEYIYNGRIFVAVWNKIYRKSFLDEYTIRFNNEIWYGEGMLFNIECLQYIETVPIIDIALYHQEPNVNSAMRNFNLENYQCGLKSMEIQKKICRKFSSKVFDAWQLHNYMYNISIIDGIIRTNSKRAYLNEYNKHVKMLRKNIWIIFKYKTRIKDKIKYIMYFILPKQAALFFINRQQWR